MVTPIYERQAAIYDPSLRADRVGVIGVGNVGSHAAVNLARLGIRSLELFDPDTVEEHNLSSQYYDRTHLGRHKALALGDALMRINPELIVYAHAELLTKCPEADIIVCAVDSLWARRDIAGMLEREHFAGGNRSNDALQARIIDCRVGGHQIEIYNCATPIEWLATIPERATDDPCGAQFIGYVSAVAGALIACQVRKILTGCSFDRSLVLNLETLQVLKNVTW